MKSRIHILAEEYGLSVFTPSNFKDQSDVEKLQGLGADIIVVVAYGIILPTTILSIAKHGCINLHPSKLPRWRGAAPIQRTIMNGDIQTAVCVIQMDAGMDTGDIIMQRDIKLDEIITSAQLHDITAQAGAEMFMEILRQFEQDTVRRVKQSEVGVTHADKILAEDEIIDWAKDAKTVHCQIRALSPKPGAYFEYHNERVKIITAEYDMQEHSETVGKVLDDRLSIACGKGILRPTLLQRQGRKMIYTEAFLRGFNIPEGYNVDFKK